MSSGTIEPGNLGGAADVHRALASLQEELEAIDYYHQRAEVTGDESLASVLIHNQDDEMEHAAMLLEWLRRTLPAFDVQLKKFLFTTGSLKALAAGDKDTGPCGSGLGLGNMN
jgi:uncharacterized protein